MTGGSRESIFEGMGSGGGSQHGGGDCAGSWVDVRTNRRYYLGGDAMKKVKCQNKICGRESVLPESVTYSICGCGAVLIGQESE